MKYLVLSNNAVWPVPRSSDEFQANLEHVFRNAEKLENRPNKQDNEDAAKVICSYRHLVEHMPIQDVCSTIREIRKKLGIKE